MKKGHRQPRLTKQFLEEHYTRRRLPITRIAAILDVHPVTIHRCLRRWSIGRNPLAKDLIDKGYLIREYVQNQRTAKAIATELASSNGFVQRSLRHHEIPVRSASQNAKIRMAKKYAGVVCRKISRGYIFVKLPDHPRANKYGYVQEHIIVAEKSLGRPLRPKEVVHHINAIKRDNRPANLYVFPSHSAHISHHNKGNPLVVSNLFFLDRKDNTSCTATIEQFAY